MRRCRSIFALLVLLAACSTAYDAEAPCTTVADCPPAPPCNIVACVADNCVSIAIASGTPASAQVDGDCKTRFCDGYGGFVEVAALEDVPADGNECTEDVCTGDVPSNPAKPEGTPCSAGTCTKSGVCGECIEGENNCAPNGPNGTARVCDASGQWTSLTCPADASYCAGGACYAPLPATEIAIGATHSCALLDDGASNVIKCWGNNANGQLGQEDTVHRGDGEGPIGPALPGIRLGEGRRPKHLIVGDNFSCAILESGSLVCWGLNQFGQLGIGGSPSVPIGKSPGEMGNNLVAVDLGTGRSVIAASAGRAHACAILDDHRVKCWGENQSGQLGLGDTNNRGDAPSEMGDQLPFVELGTGRTAKQVACGDNHTCAILDDDTVKCWGALGEGKLGIVAGNAPGNQPGEMGDNLPTVNLGTGRVALSIATGKRHTCALLDDHSVKCWGANATGALGQGDTAARGGAANTMGDALLPVDLGTGRTAKQIGAGDDTSCALLDDDSLKCWGRNTLGRLGLGNAADDHKGDQPNEMGAALPRVDVGTNMTVTAFNIGPSSSHVCAILRDSERPDDAPVKCWGGNGRGQLGAGDTMTRGTSPEHMGDLLPVVDLGHR